MVMAMLGDDEVVLEPLGDHHVPGLLAAASEARETFAFTHVPASAAEMADYVRASRRPDMLAFATIWRGRVVGSTRFYGLERWPARHGGPVTVEHPTAGEIGYTWLAPSAQRTTVNTRAKLLMLAHAFDGWQAERIYLRTDARNARSRAAILRLGAHHDGILRGHMRAADGSVRHSAYYSILREDWPDVRAGLEARLRA
jgi:RimJ/RimL family protein N-acetyltransferase